MNGYFKTVKRFDLEKDQFFFDFDICVLPSYSSDIFLFGNNLLLDGEIYLITDDDISHKIATCETKMGETAVTYNTDDNRWGTIITSQYYYNNRRLFVYYTPSSQAFQDGVKRFVMKIDVAIKRPGYYKNIGRVQYEKDIDLSAITAEKPLPKLSIEWGDDGRLAATASNMPDKRENSSYAAQSYAIKVYYYDNGKKSATETFGTNRNDVTYTNERNGKMDMSFSYWPQTTSVESANNAYTTPVFVEYQGITTLAQYDEHIDEE